MRRRSFERLAVMVCALVSMTVTTVLPAVLSPAPAAATPVAAPLDTPVLTVIPTTGLVDDQTLSVVSTGTTPGSTFVFVECDPVALKIFGGQLPPENNPNDGCEQQRDTVLFSDAAGVVAGTLHAAAIVSTAVGTDDCRVDQCFVALFALAGGPSLQVANLTFSSDACDAPGSCTVPADWASSDASRVAGATPAAATTRSASPAATTTLSLEAGLAGDLTQPGSVNGPYTGSLGGSPPPVSPVTGEGLVRLALSAPGTSWGAASPSSAVVDVAVDGGTAQQLVLFRGASTFVYAGFTGPLTTGAHTVTVTPDAALSVTSGPLQVHVQDAELEVVAPDNPSYLAHAYAPVMYGRSTSALHDTPLVAYAGSAPAAGGATRLSYTVIWSHEDAGTGFVPFLLGGSWGRMTDIENAISFTVAADGTVSDASYLWGGQPPNYPDRQGAVEEIDVPFAGSYWGHHPILRDATGNNDFSDQGTTAFRFQQAPVAAPAFDQPREAAMDANPWTYQVMGDEIDRWYTDVSTDPASPQPGDARQYAYVQLDTSGTGVTSVAVDLQLSGSPNWYRGDLGSGYPLVGTGLVRTMVKLPVGWTSQSITGVRVRAFPADAAPSLAVLGLVVRGLAPDWSLSVRPTPAPVVAAGTLDVPVALRVTVQAGDGQVVAPGSAVEPFVAGVTDSLGEALEGVPVTFAVATGPPLSFTTCGSATASATSAADGTAGSGDATAPSTVGRATVDATTADPLTAPAAFTVLVAIPPTTTTSTTSTVEPVSTSSTTPVVAAPATPVEAAPQLTG